MSRDGFSPKDFHRLCDNKGPTLTLVETTDGYKFGGYTPINWDNSGEKFEDETFIFSLNKMKKYNRKNNSRSLKCLQNYGPIFGKDDFFIDKSKNGYVNRNRTFLDKNELTDKEDKTYEYSEFSIKDYEVYTIN